MAGPVPTQMKAPPQATKLSLPQQYARIMQNIGYFAPWSRQNSWADRIAINNIRKANTPQVLEYLLPRASVCGNMGERVRN